MRLHNGARLRPKLELKEEAEFLRPHNFVRHRWWRAVGRVLIFVFEAMFEGGRIVREVGPGLKPLERHEFERDYRGEQGGNF